LHTKGKISPEKTTGAHISLIGHVTKLELLKSIQEIENQNGFSNRILWVATYRPKVVSDPHPINWEKNHLQIVESLKDTIATFGNGQKRELAWSKDGQAAWDKFYRSLKGSDSGIIGAIIARSAAHVLRLTMIYTVLDNSSLMEPKHLKAADAFWQYCADRRMDLWRENRRQNSRPNLLGAPASTRRDDPTRNSGRRFLEPLF
jgi:hypothetical protein